AGLAAGLPGRQHVLVTGGTGFIGRRLVAALATAGHDVTVLSRTTSARPWVGNGQVRMVSRLTEIASDCPIDAIVNLAGEPISDRPWTRAKRIRIIRSRLAVTRDVIALIARLDHRPAVLVSGSAIGIYGLRGDELLDETATGRPCFSARVCRTWEAAALRASRLGVRTVLLRTGLVLDRSGGLLGRLL
ncbi:NAD-dependent epimerase/dehydratase family protein, partial [Sandarakinorhabdus oryzae]|uniref:NAD-dependent epimerase/dehydratase family protein n=1 Tax=Sandarakinorhabdus oryzae TaxID=2675220 RepID=UPI0012E12FBF